MKCKKVLYQVGTPNQSIHSNIHSFYQKKSTIPKVNGDENVDVLAHRPLPTAAGISSLTERMERLTDVINSSQPSSAESDNDHDHNIYYEGITPF